MAIVVILVIPTVMVKVITRIELMRSDYYDRSRDKKTYKRIIG